MGISTKGKMMERNFDYIKVSPCDIMRCLLEKGDITLSEYMEWLIGPRDWDSVKQSIKEKMQNGIT